MTDRDAVVPLAGAVGEYGVALSVGDVDLVLDSIEDVVEFFRRERTKAGGTPLCPSCKLVAVGMIKPQARESSA